uniref:Rho-GAP domain-containing protein n=1 Tax=Sinocyclocheilus rhinocerous TaxID=307959 RepID=A0A673J719_9TELE
MKKLPDLSRKLSVKGTPSSTVAISNGQSETRLAVRLEPRGMIYVKLSLMEQRQNSLDGPEGDHEMQVFGLEARRVVEREASGLMVPLLIEKCISEIERRGCQVVGLYRLCGSAAVKKELREAFERDSHFVELSENNFPDINVITGVLKDFLRELPHPLITKQLYESVLDSMAKRPYRSATLRKLLDHLKRVASHHEVNKMTCQNLAVCFGPVLLSQRQEASCHGNRVFIDSEELASALHFKKHIEVLHYLLQLWPGETHTVPFHFVSNQSFFLTCWDFFMVLLRKFVMGIIYKLIMEIKRRFKVTLHFFI